MYSPKFSLTISYPRTLCASFAVFTDQRASFLVKGLILDRGYGDSLHMTSIYASQEIINGLYPEPSNGFTSFKIIMAFTDIT